MRFPIWRLAAAFIILSTSPRDVCAQIVQLGSNIDVGEQFRNVPALPTPRLPDGRVNLGAVPGEKIGTWLPFNSILERVTKPDDPNPEVLAKYSDRPAQSDIPFQPWSKELYDFRRNNQFEPHSRCKPSGGPRQFMTPYGVEFVDLPQLKRIFIIDLGGPHTYRTIYMDTRSHPEHVVPSYYGHSFGHWEGDALVVDTVGFNEGFWLDRTGLPHTSKLHTIERFTRTDSKTMRYDITIDDPGAYTRTWSGGFVLGWDPEQELFEYVCQDNNLATGLILGSQEVVERHSRIAP